MDKLNAYQMIDDEKFFKQKNISRIDIDVRNDMELENK